jgi:hypothetical protein
VRDRRHDDALAAPPGLPDEAVKLGLRNSTHKQKSEVGTMNDELKVAAVAFQFIAHRSDF